MIKTAKILSGFASKLPAMAGKTFQFTDGINILFGPNGCGKTTLLRILAAYSSVPSTGGWSTLPEVRNVLDPFEKAKDIEFPDCFKKSAVGECGAEVEWDGMPSLLHLSNESDSFPAAFGMSDVYSWDEEVSAVVNKPSSGQLRGNKIVKVYKMLESPPDLLTIKDSKVNDTWMAVWRKFVEYVATRPRSGRCAVLLDEPDRSLSIEFQVAFWKNLVPKITKNHQVIVATHSPFALLGSMKDANLIDMGDGYITRSKLAICDFLNPPAQTG